MNITNIEATTNKKEKKNN